MPKKHPAMPHPDYRYIEALQQNNQAVIRQMYTDFLPRISTFIRQNGGNGEDARDVFQEALITIYRKSKADGFELSSKFYTLLYGVCRNLWGNQLRKKSRSERSISDTHAYENIPEAAVDFGKMEEKNLFWEAFGKLGQDCQQLLQLFFARVKMEAIVKQLSISSVSYAKKKKFKCKEQLVRLVKADQRFAELKY